jgi:endogenous inhibitor of DNA gyrase (YacG/DUF329 family)
VVPANNPAKRFCSPRCRVADWHRRHDRAVEDAAIPSGVTNAVPAGGGGRNGVARCPHCARPIAVINLLVAPAAAHVATPAVPHG